MHCDNFCHFYCDKMCALRGVLSSCNRRCVCSMMQVKDHQITTAGMFPVYTRHCPVLYCTVRCRFCPAATPYRAWVSATMLTNESLLATIHDFSMRALNLSYTRFFICVGSYLTRKSHWGRGRPTDCPHYDGCVFSCFCSLRG